MDTEVVRSVVLVHDFVCGTRQLGDAVAAMADLAASALDTDLCGVTLYDSNGRPRTVAFTQATVPDVDKAQYEADSGPCLDAARRRRVNRIDDTTTEQRWPEFCVAATANGVRSTLAVPVLVGDSGVGALNVYWREAGAANRASLEMAELLAGQTAVISAYYDKADLADHMAKAMHSRASIEQAKGVIMASSGCAAEVAFDILRKQSQAENRKLRDVAAEIVGRQARRSGA